MNALLKWTGVGGLISFYRYVYFNGPGVTRWSGIGLILLVGLIHAPELPAHFGAAFYLGVCFVAVCVGSLVSALGVLRGSRRWGWLLGSVISAVALVGYLISRLFGLPGLGESLSDWNTPLGSLAVIFEVLFVTLCFTIVTGMNVAYPQERGWHD